MSLNRQIKIYVAALFLLPAAAYAVPSQQLDIEGGTYDNGDDTIIVEGADALDFTLVSVTTANENNGNGNGGSLSQAEIEAETFYLTVALVGIPEGDGVTASDFGTILINGVAYTSDTANLVFGFPPTGDDSKMGDYEIAPHDVYPVWYFEVAYSFADMTSCETYNTQDDAGMGAVDGTGSYCAEFDISTELNDGTGLTALHFDTYTLNCDEPTDECSDETIKTFAPFSKDAEARVPEPGTLSLLLLGILIVSVGKFRKLQQL